MISTLKNKYLALEHILDNKPFYYRAATLIICVFAIYFIWSGVVRPFLQTDTKTWKTKLSQVQTQIDTFNTQIETIKAKIAAGHSATEYGKLEQSLNKNKNTLAIFENQLVPQKRLDDVIHSMLDKDGLKLVKISLGKAKPFFTPEHPNQTSISEQSLKMTFEGTYAETLKYLQTMEQSNWHFFFDSLNYAVEDYPTAKIKLTVQTLVQSKGGKNEMG